MNAVRTPVLGPALAGECTCLNRYDSCAHCRETEAEAARCKAQAAAEPPPPPPSPPVPPALPLAERWLSSQEAAAVLAVGMRTLWRMVAAHRLPQPVRFSRRLVRFSGALLAQWMRERADDAQRGG